MRDKSLDIYRGLIMIYIIGVVHTIYWGVTISNTMKSLCLFEMPIIFFISGASHSLSGKKNIYVYYLKKVERILVPFFVFCLVILSAVFSLNCMLKSYGASGALTLSSYDIFINWINPFGTFPSNMNYLNWHLWFIPIYIIIAAIIPLIYYIYIKLPHYLKFIPLIIFMAITFLTDKWVQVGYYQKTVVFYLFWTYLGFSYGHFKAKPLRKWYLVAMTSFAFGSLFLLVKYGKYVFDMQVNKFPPNLAFMVFSIGCFSVIVIFRDLLKKLYSIKYINLVIDKYSQYGFTMYLYQPFSYLAISIIINEVLKVAFIYKFKLFCLVLYFFFVICFGLIYPKLFGRFERIEIKLFNRIYACFLRTCKSK